MGKVTRLKDYRRRPKRGASKGAYSTVPYERLAPYARALIPAIRRQYADADFFTREDLIHMPVFGHISTISRYRYICGAVRIALRDGDLVSVSRNDLALPEKAKLYPTRDGVQTEYSGTVARLVERRKYNLMFTVGDVIADWKTDPHLTENTKRGIVRRALRRMVFEGRLIEAEQDFAYYLEDEGAEDIR